MTKPSTYQDEDRDLQRRREATQGARADVDRASGRLRKAENAVALHDAKAEGHRTTIATAKQTVAMHKEALRAHEENRDRLVSDLKQARKASDKAARSATRAEARYERSVLAGMVEREKSADRQAHQDGAQPGDTAATGPQDAPELIHEPTETGTKVTVS